MLGRRILAPLAIAGGAFVGACKAPGPPAPPAPTTLEEAQARLADNAEALSSAGIAVGAPVVPTGDTAGGGEARVTTAPPSAEREEVAEDVEVSRKVGGVAKERRAARQEAKTRCGRVCDLAEATCDLQVQICDLADRHVDDVRYEDVCQRAELQCDAAARECQLCQD